MASGVYNAPSNIKSENWILLNGSSIGQKSVEHQLSAVVAWQILKLTNFWMLQMAIMSKNNTT